MRIPLLLHLLLHVYIIQGNTVEKERLHNCFSSCPAGWEIKGKMCFLWPQSTKSWEDAEKYCNNNNNSNLASVTCQEIHNYIQARVNTLDWKSCFWVGGTDKEEEGNWRWTDGSTWNFTQWSKHDNQPNNSWGKEDCLQIFHPKPIEGWNDNVCREKFKFVCSLRICLHDSHTKVQAMSMALTFQYWH